MKINALKKLRRRLANNEAVYGVWVTFDSPAVTELAVAFGVDWVVIDAEHGHLDWKEIAEHIRTTVRSDTVALVRIAARDTILTKRALDIGADGVLIPSIETADQLREAILDAKYPPQGRRGIGGERATVWGQCLVPHTAEANDHVLVVPLIESVNAMETLPAMCQVDGAELFFFGPADFSASAGHRGQWEGPGVAEQILAAKKIIRAAGKRCGILGRNNDDLAQRLQAGFQFLALGSDSGFFVRALRESLFSVGRDRQPATSLDPNDGLDNPIAIAQTTTLKGK